MVIFTVMLILIVDDHAILRDAMTLGLKLSGHDVAQAGNGAAALMQMAQRLPDVLVTDIDMPGMNGAELIVRARRAYPGLPIVAMSGGGDLGDVGVLRMAARLGAANVLYKPFSADELCLAVEGALAGA